MEIEKELLMPRRARVSLAGVPHHIIQRGNNRSVCFFTDDDYRFYLEWLAKYLEECECKLHAFVLMTNHVHLLITPATCEGLGQLMKRLGQRYVQYVNRRYRRSGTLWEGRFRSCLTQEESYVLSCYRYIELNPVRAGMVDEIRKSTNGNCVLGTERFRRQVEEALGRRAVPGKPGRPLHRAATRH